jgi:hypothetical protein
MTVIVSPIGLECDGCRHKLDEGIAGDWDGAEVWVRFERPLCIFNGLSHWLVGHHWLALTEGNRIVRRLWFGVASGG